LILSGHVYDNCDTNKPIPNVKLDIWHANPLGEYSAGNDYTCRAVIYTDSKGYYQFTSLMPGRYDDGGYRPAHIHFKIAENLASRYLNLTTQLYFNVDYYLFPNDSCASCQSNQPSLITTVTHPYDIKTYQGVWNIGIRGRGLNEADISIPEPEKGPYTEVKDHIISKRKYTEEEVRQILADLN